MLTCVGCSIFNKMDTIFTGQKFILLWSACLLTEVYGNNSTSSSSDTSTGNNAFPKIASTLAIILGAVLIAVVLAKIADMCYDRAVIRDDSSDISENTKSLIRARLAIIQMKKKEQQKKTGTRSIFKMWSSKSKGQSSGSDDKSVVINVEEAKQNGIVSIMSGNAPAKGADNSPSLLQKLQNGGLDNGVKPQSTDLGDENSLKATPKENGTTIQVSLKPEKADNKQKPNQNKNNNSNSTKVNLPINANKNKPEVKKKTDVKTDSKKGRSVTFKDDLEIESMGSKF